MEEVVVLAREEDQNIRNIEMSVEKLSAAQMKHIPHVMGEADLIRSIQLLPGVSSVGEGATGFNVRGGNFDENLVLVNGAGALGVRPSDGTVLWKHAWPGDSIVQPAVLAGGDLLIGTGSGMGSNSGMSRVTVSRAAGAWQVTERWVSRGLKPYFNDFVVNDGHAFGFDGSILACIDLADGARKWKGGRYGNGQLVLLPDQDLLLVLSEEGELALVGATPDGFTELARFPAIEGKTWNHPVVVGDVLLVRNGEEMAAFRLPAAGS